MSDYNILQKAKEHDDSILGKAVFKALEQGWDGSGLKVDAPIPMIIYNHDFAKALWSERGIGEDWPDLGYEYQPIKTYWQHHLQQMVIADDPIAYLGSHL